MRFNPFVTYANGSVKEVRDLGYVLRNANAIKDIQVNAILPTQGNWVDVLTVSFHDGRVYSTVWADKKVLYQWLNRRVLRGIPLMWYGEEEIIGTR